MGPGDCNAAAYDHDNVSESGAVDARDACYLTILCAFVFCSSVLRDGGC